MNLRERILEKIHPGGIGARALYDQLRGEQLAAVDCVLGAMVRDHTLRLVNTVYFLASDPRVCRAEEATPPRGGSGAPPGPRSAWPVALMDKAPARESPAPKPVQAAPAKSPSRLVASPAMVAAKAKAAPPPARTSEPATSVSPAPTPQSLVTQRCRVCEYDLPLGSFQLLHGKRHHTCKRCHGMTSRKSKGAPTSGVPHAPDSRASQDTSRGAEAKVRTGPAIPPGGEPVRPELRVSRAAISFLVQSRDKKAEEVADLQCRLADARVALALADELLAALQGGK